MVSQALTTAEVVWKDRIYLSSPDGGQDTVLAFDLDGKRLWQTKLGPEKKPKHRKLGSSSPFCRFVSSATIKCVFAR